MSKGEEVVSLLRSVAGQWIYTNDERRLDPERYKASDCSGTLRWAFSKFGKNIGVWTGDQSQSGIEIARGHYPSEIPWDIMLPGDRILMTATYWNLWDFSRYLCHTECYCGGGTMIGHPGGYGPQEKWAQAWMEAYNCITWMVRRDFEGDDDVSAKDVWTYDWEDTAPGGNMYNCVLEIHDQSQPNKMWEYDYEGTAPGGNMYNCVVNMYKMVSALQSKVDKMQASGGSVAIDYDKLANAVADKLAKRLVS